MPIPPSPPLSCRYPPAPPQGLGAWLHDHLRLPGGHRPGAGLALLHDAFHSGGDKLGALLDRFKAAGDRLAALAANGGGALLQQVGQLYSGKAADMAALFAQGADRLASAVAKGSAAAQAVPVNAAGALDARGTALHNVSQLSICVPGGWGRRLPAGALWEAGGHCCAGQPSGHRAWVLALGRRRPSPASALPSSSAAAAPLPVPPRPAAARSSCPPSTASRWTRWRSRACSRAWRSWPSWQTCSTSEGAPLPPSAAASLSAEPARPGARASARRAPASAAALGARSAQQGRRPDGPPSPLTLFTPQHAAAGRDRAAPPQQAAPFSCDPLEPHLVSKPSSAAPLSSTL